jgi:hypothetical protein
LRAEAALPAPFLRTEPRESQAAAWRKLAALTVLAPFPLKQAALAAEQQAAALPETAEP